MSRAGRIAGNAAAIGLSIGLNRALGLVVFVYVARVLGAAALGRLALALSLALVFQHVATHGLAQLTVRGVARRPADVPRSIAALWTLGGAAALVAVLPLVAAARLLEPGPDVARLAAAAAAVLVASSLAELSESLVQGLERMELVPAVRLATNVPRVGATLLALRAGAGVETVLVLLAAAQALNALAFTALAWRLAQAGPPSLDRAFRRRLARAAVPFVAIAAFAVLNQQAGILLLTGLTDAATVGEYSAALKIVEIGQALLPAVLVALAPGLAASFERSPSEFEAITNGALRAMLVVVLPVAVAIVALAGPIVRLLYGGGYDGAVPVLRLLVAGLVLLAPHAVLTRAVVASDNERITLRVAAVNLAVNLLLGLTLIPRFGAPAAAGALVVAIACGALQNAWFLGRHVLALRVRETLARPAAAGLAMGATLVAGAAAGLAPPASVAIGLVVYLAAAFAVGALTRDDLRLAARLGRAAVGR